MAARAAHLALLAGALTFASPSAATAMARKEPRRAAPAKRRVPQPRAVAAASGTPVPSPPGAPAAERDETDETDNTGKTSTDEERTTVMPIEPHRPEIETDATQPIPPPAFERKLQLGGRLFTYYRVPLADLRQPVQQFSSSLWLEAHARMTEGTFADVSAVGDLLTPSASGNAEARARVREAYAGAHDRGLEVRVGQQIIAWGNADGISAIDLLTAHDYSFFSVSGDARQIGAPSAQIKYSPGEGPLHIVAVWQPVSPASKVFIPPRRLPANVRIADEEQPPIAFASSEAAVEIGYSPGGWDVSAIAFHGFNHLWEPYLKSLDGASAEIGRAHHRFEAVGVQTSAALGDWVLRFEGAYVLTENRDGKNRLVVPTHVDAIAGVERALGDRVRGSLQALCRFHPFFVPVDAPFAGPAAVAAAEQQIARVNAAVFNYTHQVRPGASLALGYTSEDESLELGVAGLANFVGFDWVVQPSIGYRVLAALKLDVGVQVFGGNKSTSLGFLADQSGAFTQATYTF